MMNRTRRSSFVAVALSFLLALSTTVFISRVGQAAPQAPVNFSMRSLNDGTVTSANLRGKVVVLAYGATWLPLSRAQLQGLKQISDDYAARGVAVYWVSADSDSPKSRNYASDDQIHSFVSKFGISVPVLRDPNGTVAKQLGVDQLPAVVILNKDGSVAATIGGLDPQRSFADQVSPKLDQILGK
jgi:peroxiredoxin